MRKFRGSPARIAVAGALLLGAFVVAVTLFGGSASGTPQPVGTVAIGPGQTATPWDTMAATTATTESGASDIALASPTAAPTAAVTVAPTAAVTVAPTVTLRPPTPLPATPTSRPATPT